MTKAAKLTYLWVTWGLATFVAWYKTGSVYVLIGMTGISLIFGFLASVDIFSEDTGGSQ